MTQRDQLAECNVHGEALDTFQSVWCKRCISPECSRSASGQNRFEQRVRTWEERLFTNPPKMSPDDPRFTKFSAQRFITIDPGRTPEIRTSSWVDPRDLTEPATQGTIPAVTTPAPEQAPEPAPVGQVSPTAMLMNAQSQNGRVLSGVRADRPSKGDPWAVPAPAENVVPVGTTIKFGGSGVDKG